MRTVTFFAAILCCGSAHAADLVAHDLVLQLFAARAEKPIDLSGKNFDNLDLSGIDFKRANLKKASFFGADLTAANLTDCDLEGANLNRATLTKADFSRANLRSAHIRRPSIFSDMSPAPAEAPSFRDANLEKAWLEGMFDYTDFSGAHLAGARFGALNPRDNQGIITGPSLRGANFANADLNAVILERADLSFANFSSARLDGAILRGANLSNANLSNASLRGVDLLSASTEDPDWADTSLPVQNFNR